MGETAPKLESLSGKARQTSLAGSYPGVWVSDQAHEEDVPRRDGHSGEGGTIRGFSPARESTAMFGFSPSISGINSSGFKPTIPMFNGKQALFSRWKQESAIYSKRYGFDAVFARSDVCRDENVGDPDYQMVRLQDEFGAVSSYLNA